MSSGDNISHLSAQEAIIGHVPFLMAYPFGTVPSRHLADDVSNSSNPEQHRCPELDGELNSLTFDNYGPIRFCSSAGTPMATDTATGRRCDKTNFWPSLNVH